MNTRGKMTRSKKILVEPSISAIIRTFTVLGFEFLGRAVLCLRGMEMRRKCNSRFLRSVAVISLLIASSGRGAIKDAESASHGDDASRYQIVETYKFSGYDLIQINLPVLSHYSYLLVSDGKTLIVDPGRDVQFYVDLVREKNLSVSGIFLTHSHADFVAGHMELVKIFNCPIYQSAKSAAKYKIEPIADGITLEVGKALLEFLDTPGHVLDGTSATVGPAKGSPELILTGDFLFVGGVGIVFLLCMSCFR